MPVGQSTGRVPVGQATGCVPVGQATGFVLVKNPCLAQFVDFY